MKNIIIRDLINNKLSRNKFNTYNLIFLIMCFIKENIINKFIEKRIIKFPNRIDEYYFDSFIDKPGIKKSYLLAVYKNKKGKKAVAKIISNKIKGYAYYSLLNEISVYEVLNKVTKRVEDFMPQKFKDIYIPGLLRKI